MEQSDIQRYIDDEIEESLILEYKRAESLDKTDSKKKDITKDVSAMANSAGGRIFYGVAEYDGDDKRHLPEKINPVSRSAFSREWLEQVINDIRPRIEGITITPVIIERMLDQVVYVVDIPQSHTAHQATDRKYYKRFNFMCVPMEDYEIRDVMSRKMHPDIRISFKIEKRLEQVGWPNGDGRLSREERVAIFLIVTAVNCGNVYAKYVNCCYSIPIALVESFTMELLKAHGKDIPEYYEYQEVNTTRDFLGMEGIRLKTGPSRYEPILPGLSKQWETEIYGDIEKLDLTDLSIRWTAYADNSAAKSGEIALNEIEFLNLVQ